MKHQSPFPFRALALYTLIFVVSTSPHAKAQGTIEFDFNAFLSDTSPGYAATIARYPGIEAEGYIESFLEIAQSANLEGNKVAAYKLATFTMELSKIAKNKAQEAESAYLLSNLSISFKEFERAIEQSRQALLYYESQKNYPYIIDALLNISSCQSLLSDTTSAINTLEQAIAVGKQIPISPGFIKAIKVLAAIYEKSDPERAHQLYNQALDLIKSQSGKQAAYEYQLLLEEYFKFVCAEENNEKIVPLRERLLEFEKDVAFTKSIWLNYRIEKLLADYFLYFEDPANVLLYTRKASAAFLINALVEEYKVLAQKSGFAIIQQPSNPDLNPWRRLLMDEHADLLFKTAILASKNHLYREKIEALKQVKILYNQLKKAPELDFMLNDQFYTGYSQLNEVDSAKVYFQLASIRFKQLEPPAREKWLEICPEYQDSAFVLFSNQVKIKQRNSEDLRNSAYNLRHRRASDRALTMLHLAYAIDEENGDALGQVKDLDFMLVCALDLRDESTYLQSIVKLADMVRSKPKLLSKYFREMEAKTKRANQEKPLFDAMQQAMLSPLSALTWLTRRSDEVSVEFVIDLLRAKSVVMTQNLQQDSHRQRQTASVPESVMQTNVNLSNAFLTILAFESLNLPKVQRAHNTPVYPLIQAATLARMAQLYASTGAPERARELALEAIDWLEKASLIPDTIQGLSLIEPWTVISQIGREIKLDQKLVDLAHSKLNAFVKQTLDPGFTDFKFEPNNSKKSTPGGPFATIYTADQLNQKERTEEAIQLLEQVLQDSMGITEAYLMHYMLASMYYKLGSFESAEKYALESQRLAQIKADPDDIGTCWLLLARIYDKLDRLDLTIDCFNQAKSKYTGRKRIDFAHVLSEQSYSILRKSREVQDSILQQRLMVEALNFQRQAIEIHEEFGLIQDIGIDYLLMGQIYLNFQKKEMFDTAETCFRKAIHYYTLAQQQGSRTVSMYKVNLMLAQTLIHKLDVITPEDTVTQQATINEIRQLAAEVLFEIDSTSASIQSDMIKTDWIREKQEGLEFVSHVFARLGGDNSPGFDAFVASQYKKGYAFRTRVNAELQNPAKATKSKGFEMKEEYAKLRALADRHRSTCIINYNLTRWGCTASVLYEGKVVTVPLEVGEEGLTNIVNEYVNFLKSPQKEFDVRTILISRKLYERLLQPLAPYFSHADGLVISADGVLNLLPFEVLIVDQDSVKSNPIYLLETAPPISYLPALELAYSWEENQKPNTYNYEFVGFGRNNYKQTRLSKWSDPLPNLKFAEKEIESSLKHFNRGIGFIGDSCSESNLRKMLNQHLEFLHVSSHGVVIYDENVDVAALVVGAEDQTTDDGMVNYSEVYKATGSVRYVVLSSCNSSLGRLQKGTGIVGLVRSFFKLGAQSIVASLWEVDDQATSVVMSNLYAARTEGGNINFAAAMRDIKLRMLGASDKRAPKGSNLRGVDDEVDISVGYRHPFFWSSYTVYGF